jgi:hypothetical protein
MHLWEGGPSPFDAAGSAQSSSSPGGGFFQYVTIEFYEHIRCNALEPKKK